MVRKLYISLVVVSVLHPSCASRVAIGPTSSAKQPEKVAASAVRYTAARRLAGPGPVYPAKALAEGLQRDVTVFVIVELDGRVSDVKVLRSGGPEFDGVAVEAAKQTIYEPATRDGSPIRSSLSYTFRFRVESAP